MEMEPIYRIMSWHKQDILDTIEGAVKPYMQIALDSQLPLSVHMFRVALPPNNVEFQALVAKCSTVSVEFNTFTIQPNMTITCRFNFNMQFQTFLVVSFQQLQPFDPTLLQKRLSSLKFVYTIPYTHLTFAVLNSKYKFVYNGSYSTYITDGGQSYTNFIAGA